MSNETENRYDRVAPPMTEMSVLKELEGLLREHDYLHGAETTLPVLQTGSDLDERKTGFYAKNNAVVALSLRYCGLTSLPASLGQLTHLQQLDLTGNLPWQAVTSDTPGFEE